LNIENGEKNNEQQTDIMIDNLSIEETKTLDETIVNENVEQVINEQLDNEEVEQVANEELAVEEFAVETLTNEEVETVVLEELVNEQVQTVPVEQVETVANEEPIKKKRTYNKKKK